MSDLERAIFVGLLAGWLLALIISVSWHQWRSRRTAIPTVSAGSDRSTAPIQPAPPPRWPVEPADWMLALLPAAWFLLGLLSSLTAPSTHELPSEKLLLGNLLLASVMQGGLILLVGGRILSRPDDIGARWLGLRPGWPPIARALAWTLPILLLTMLVQWAAVGSLSALGHEPRAQLQIELLRQGLGLPALLTMVFTAVVMAPLAEELIFRGYLHPVLGNLAGRVPGALLSAALFALAHGNLVGLPAFFVLALLLAGLYERTGTIWAPIIVHALFNSLNLVMLFTLPAPTG